MHALSNVELGYWFLDDADVAAKKWTPPQDLLSFIDSARQAGKKIVYIGFGSIMVPDPKGMTRCVVDAILQSGVYAILSKGWSDRLQAAQAPQPEEPLPKQIYSVSSVPHDWLFKRIDAACHHGGAGTTGASLRGMSEAHHFSQLELTIVQPESRQSSSRSSEISFFGLIVSRHLESVLVSAN